MGFIITADHRVKIKESEKIKKNIQTKEINKKALEREGDGDSICS